MALRNKLLTRCKELQKQGRYKKLTNLAFKALEDDKLGIGDMEKLGLHASTYEK